MAVWMSTRSGAHRFLHILLFAFLAVCPTVARAACGDTGDIPFTITLLHPMPPGPANGAWFIVKGPWGRDSDYPLLLRDLPVGQPCNFYSAKETIFSPYGSWRFLIAREVFTSLVAKYFSLKEGTSNRVYITVDPLGGDRFDVTVSTGTESPRRPVEALDEAAQQAQASSPKEVSVNAWLGDSKDAASGIPESDVYSFFGTAGDTVTIRLEADPRAGNNGGRATLRFEGRQEFGMLPNTITAQLPSTGRYQIAVEQRTGGSEEDYRGGYILRVESARGEIDTLVPARSVEK